MALQTNKLYLVTQETSCVLVYSEVHDNLGTLGMWSCWEGQVAIYLFRNEWHKFGRSDAYLFIWESEVG